MMFQVFYPVQLNNAEIILTFQNNSELREVFGELYKSSDSSSSGTQLLTCVPAGELACQRGDLSWGMLL